MMTQVDKRSPRLKEISGLGENTISAQQAFEAFFEQQSGSWNSGRTYHYVGEGNREDSNTTFDVSRLTPGEVDEILKANGDADVFSKSVRDQAQGFRVSFLTKMESQEELVRSSTDLAFLPTSVEDNIISGQYYRLMGYEESGPTKAEFEFDAAKAQLTMITTYTRVVSVDEITLTNPTFRVRKIINYARPADGEPLSKPVLVGFGVEQKRGVADAALVE
jgi:CpeS-like protein